MWLSNLFKKKEEKEEVKIDRELDENCFILKELEAYDLQYLNTFIYKLDKVLLEELKLRTYDYFMNIKLKDSSFSKSKIYVGDELNNENVLKYLKIYDQKFDLNNRVWIIIFTFKGFNNSNFCWVLNETKSRIIYLGDDFKPELINEYINKLDELSRVDLDKVVNIDIKTKMDYEVPREEKEEKEENTEENTQINQ